LTAIADPPFASITATVAAAGATGDAVSTRAICLLDAWLDRLAAAPSR
jgi:hypothetical protein